MLSVQNSLPIKNFSQVVISDQPGSIYKPGENARCRVRIPASSVPMIDPHSSYLKFDLQVKPPATAGSNTYAVGLSNRQGAEQVVRDMRVYLDNQPVEEITHYNILDKVRQDYGQEMAQRNFNSLFNHATLIGADTVGYFVRNYDATGAGQVVYNEIPTKQQFTPMCSGVLSSKVGIPLVATGDLVVEFILEDNGNVLSPIATLGVEPLDANLGRHLAGKDSNAGGTVDAVQADGSLVSFTVVNRAGSNFANAEESPFFPGNVIQVDCADSISTNDETRWFTVASCETTADGIKVTVNAPAGTYGNDAVLTNVEVKALFNVKTAGANASTKPTDIALGNDLYTYEVSKVEYVCRTISAPPIYLQSLQDRVRSEGFSMDIPTTTTYLQNILAGIPKQSLLTPNYASRVKSLLQVPLKALQTSYFYDREGKLEDIRNYIFKIGSRVAPQRAVDMTNTTANSAVKYISQEHAQELHKTLNAMGIGMKTMLPINKNFCIGRSLSVMGSSEDLADKGVRTEVEYATAPTQALNVFSFVHMVKRILVSPAGLQIFS